MAFLMAVLVVQQRCTKQASNSYTRNVLLGLFFSTIGDAFLIWSDVWFDAFLGGIAAFGTVCKGFMVHRFDPILTLPFRPISSTWQPLV